MKDKKTVKIIAIFVLVALVIFFVMGFLRKGPRQPDPANQSNPNSIQQ